MTEKDPLVRHTGKSTSVWKHFGICYMVICAPQDSATYLFTHLKLCHKVYNQTIKGTNKTSKSKGPLPPSTAKQLLMKDCIMRPITHPALESIKKELMPSHSRRAQLALLATKQWLKIINISHKYYTITSPFHQPSLRNELEIMYLPQNTLPPQRTFDQATPRNLISA